MNQFIREIKYMKGMMRSCYAYHSLWKTNSYIAKYELILGGTVFNRVYDKYGKYLSDTFTIQNDVGTCSDGLSYNSLVKK